MRARDLRRYATAAALSASAFALGATDAHATHFRYGTIRWEVTGQTATTVDLKVTAESAWRCTFFSAGGCDALPVPPATLNTGQTIQLQRILAPTTTFASTPFNVTIASRNPGEDWFVGSLVFTFTGVAKANLPARLFWSGNARISTLRDLNNDRNFRVEATVTADAATSGGNAASPAASILPIITLAHGLHPATFFIPAGDVENDGLSWSISPTSRSSLFKAAPDGADDIGPPTLSINPATGEVSWNTDEELVPTVNGDFYAVQFLVTDSKGAETPVDALLRLVPNQGTAPRALIDGSINPAAFSVRPNRHVSFTVTGEDDDAGASVTLTSGALPAGSTMTPTLPYAGSSPRSSVFDWTPTLAQSGNTYVVPYAVTDNLGLQDTNSAQITVLQNFPPTLTCPGPQTVEATGPGGATATVATFVDDPDDDPLTVRWTIDGVLAETDSVPDPPATVDVVHNYSINPVPAHPVHIEVSDTFAATQTCDTSVTVVDTTPPALTLPPSQVLEATGPNGAVATWDPPTAVDLVDGPVPVTCDHTSGETFPLATTTVTCTARDSHNNLATGTFTITVQDTTPPVISGTPGDMVLEATSASGAVATWPPPTAQDIVDGSVPVTCVPASGSTFPLDFVTPVTCTATDAHGNSSQTHFTVRVQDTTPPVISGTPGNMVLEATGPGGAVATWPPPTAQDIVDGSVSVTCVPSSGSTFALDATTTVTCTATDAHANSSQTNFTVRVQDTTPPVISNMPANIVAPSTGPNGAIITWPPPTAVDIVDGAVPVFCVPPSGSLFPIGTTTVTCTATDAHGNASARTFTVTIQGDTRPPDVCLELTPGTLWPPNHKMRDIDIKIVVRDDQDLHPVCRIDSVTSSEPVTGPRFGNTSPDWILNGFDLQLRAERYSREGRTYTVKASCVDDAGNVGTATAFVRVPHDMGGGGHDGFADDPLHGGGTSRSCCNRPPFGVAEGDLSADADSTGDPQRHGNPGPGPNGDNCPVYDTKPPKVCLGLQPAKLWPANATMRPIQLTIDATDNQDPHPTCSVTSVTSTEPVSGPGYGNTSPDWTVSNLNVSLRAERFDRVGRTYTVTVACADDNNNIGTASSTVRVPWRLSDHDLIDVTLHGGGESKSCCSGGHGLNRHGGGDGDCDDDDDLTLLPN
jgi:hypothetical protein